MKKTLFSILIISLLILSVTTLGCTNNAQEEKETYVIFYSNAVAVYEFFNQENMKQLGLMYNGTTNEVSGDYKEENGKYIKDSTTGLEDGYKYIYDLNNMEFKRDTPDSETPYVTDLFNITGSDVAVFIYIDGDQWDKGFSGSIGKESEQFSVEGEAPEVYTLEDADTVSVSLQKESSSDNEMTVILFDPNSEEIIEQSQTSASYGVISASGKDPS